MPNQFNSIAWNKVEIVEVWFKSDAVTIKSPADVFMKSELKLAYLYGIIDLGYVAIKNATSVLQSMVNGGAGIIQLRAKGYDLNSIRQLAIKLKPICESNGIPFIINDHPEIAHEIGADGLHIGQDDGSLASARSIVGNEMILGRSTHSVEQAKKALSEGFDYIGFGPLFPTPTKAGRAGIGLENVKLVESTVGQKIPVFCIGGIKRSNLKEVQISGAKRVVVVSDLLMAEDVKSAAVEITTQLAK